MYCVFIPSRHGSSTSLLARVASDLVGRRDSYRNTGTNFNKVRILEVRNMHWFGDCKKLFLRGGRGILNYFGGLRELRLNDDSSACYKLEGKRKVHCIGTLMHWHEEKQKSAPDFKVPRITIQKFVWGEHYVERWWGKSKSVSDILYGCGTSKLEAFLDIRKGL